MLRYVDSVDSISLHFLDAAVVSNLIKTIRFAPWLARVFIELYRTVELCTFAKAKKGGGFIVIGIDSIRGFLSLGIVLFVI